jgi:hypothetical protein
VDEQGILLHDASIGRAAGRRNRNFATTGESKGPGWHALHDAALVRTFAMA